MSKQMAKGSSFERMVADYLRTELGQPVDRRVKTGAKDKGDIAGHTLMGHDVVVECKNCKAHQFSAWLDEAEAEKVNANASYGIAVIHRKGYGSKRIGKSYVLMELDTWCDVVRSGEYLW